MENTNVITIGIEEYKALLCDSIEKEYIDQIRTLLENINDMETKFAEQRKSLDDNSMFWYKRWETENNAVKELEEAVKKLEEELSSYKPAQQEQEAS